MIASPSLLLRVLLALPALAACQEAPVAPPAPIAPEATPPPPAPPAGAGVTELRGCELLSVEEASAAAGERMRVVSPPGTPGCSMDSVPPNLTIELMALRRTAVFDEIARHESSEALAGIGDAAYFVAVEGRTLAQLHVARGDRMLISTLRAEREGPDLKGIAERLGRTLAPRL